jgi:hypothetical protein
MGRRWVDESLLAFFLVLGADALHQSITRNGKALAVNIGDTKQPLTSVDRISSPAIAEIKPRNGTGVESNGHKKLMRSTEKQAVRTKPSVSKRSHGHRGHLLRESAVLFASGGEVSPLDNGKVSHKPKAPSSPSASFVIGSSGVIEDTAGSLVALGQQPVQQTPPQQPPPQQAPPVAASPAQTVPQQAAPQPIPQTVPQQAAPQPIPPGAASTQAPTDDGNGVSFFTIALFFLVIGALIAAVAVAIKKQGEIRERLGGRLLGASANNDGQFWKSAKSRQTYRKNALEGAESSDSQSQSEREKAKPDEASKRDSSFPPGRKASESELSGQEDAKPARTRTSSSHRRYNTRSSAKDELALHPSTTTASSDNAAKDDSVTPARSRAESGYRSRRAQSQTAQASAAAPEEVDL